MDTPWRVSWSQEGQTWHVLGESGHAVANAYESEVNARWMAAAPDLLEAVCAAAVMPWGYCVCPPQMGDMEGKSDEAHCGECRDVRAAIAKAKEGQE